MNRATSALVALEDAAPELMFSTVRGTDLPLWPLLRWPLASAMSNTEFGIDLAARVESSSSKARRTVRALVPSRDASRAQRRHADVLFVGAGNTAAASDDGLRNWLFDDDARTLGDRALILQDAPLGRGASRPAFRRTATFDDAIVATELAVRLRPDAQRARDAERFARALIGMVDFDIDERLAERAVRTTVARALRAPGIASAFGRVLDRVRPRAVVMQGAAYGDRAGQITEAKRRGIRVAELQHGWIGAAHAAYNFGRAARDPRLAATLPDELLTFGEFWSESVSVPFATLAIGKPHLETAQAATVPPAERERRVLVASTVVHPDAAAAFTLKVRDALPADWRVTFRPHPQERSDVARRYPTLLGADRVDLDDELDVYASFARSRVVISGPSTVLYEAIALDCPVILRRSNITDYYMDPGIFRVAIDEDEDIAEVLHRVIGASGDSGGVDPVVRDRLWAPGSRERFSRWAAALS